jgi:hypothetical protein
MPLIGSFRRLFDLLAGLDVVKDANGDHLPTSGKVEDEFLHCPRAHISVAPTLRGVPTVSEVNFSQAVAEVTANRREELSEQIGPRFTRLGNFPAASSRPMC